MPRTRAQRFRSAISTGIFEWTCAVADTGESSAEKATDGSAKEADARARAALIEHDTSVACLVTGQPVVEVAQLVLAEVAHRGVGVACLGDQASAARAVAARVE